MKKRLLTEIIAALYIFLFLYAASSKLINYNIFRVQVGQSPMLAGIAKWIAWLIPLLEISIAVMLAKAKFRLTGLYASLILMTIFSTYIFAITKYSEYIPCSCGGILQKMSWNQHLLFNISLVFLAIVAIFQYSSTVEQTAHNVGIK